MLRMLLRPEVAEQIGRLYKSGVTPTAKQREDFRASRAARPRLASKLAGARASAKGQPENYAVVGSVAHIEVAGVLSETPDLLAWFFGLDGSTYRDIRDSFALAGADNAVKSVKLRVGSPGGYLDGLFETLGTIQAFHKPIDVVASQAASAAYAIAAIAGPITAAGVASEFGSVGVAASYYVDPRVVDIASTDAPNKRPDVTTEEGRAIVRAELDALHELFVEAIASGRGTTMDVVNAEYGRGSVLLAGEALRRGMIDSAPSSLTSSASTSMNAMSADDGGEMEIENMDKKQLKRTSPDLYEEILEEGRAQEHDRVIGFLELGKHAKQLGFNAALHDIRSRTALTPGKTAEYMGLALNQRDIDARQDDSDAAGAAVDGRTGPNANHGGGGGSETLDNGDLVARAMGLGPVTSEMTARSRAAGAIR